MEGIQGARHSIDRGRIPASFPFAGRKKMLPVSLEVCDASAEETGGWACRRRSRGCRQLKKEKRSIVASVDRWRESLESDDQHTRTFDHCGRHPRQSCSSCTSICRTESKDRFRADWEQRTA